MTQNVCFFFIMLPQFCCYDCILSLLLNLLKKKSNDDKICENMRI